MSHLLDTNFVIGLLRGRGTHWEHLDRLLTERLPAVSVVTRAEVFAGCHPHEEPATRRLLDRFESIPVNAAIADLAGKYVYHFRRRGLILHLEDAVIGASAVIEGVIVVTHNVDHFPMLALGKNLLRFPA